MAVNAIQYIKNVGRSFGYSAIDVFEGYNPQVKALASGAKEFSSDLYQTVKDFKSVMVDKESEKGLLSKGRDVVSTTRDNLLADLKSGNWYNKQRSNAAEESAMNAMFDLGDDFDFNLDDIDFGLDDDEAGSEDSLSTDTAATISSNAQNARAIIDSMDVVGSKTAGAISTATVRSADYIVANAKQGNKALYSLQAKGFQNVATGIAAVNANIASLVSLGQPLTTHMQNSATFFTQSAEYQKNVLDKLDQIIKNTAPPDPKKNSYGSKTTMSSLMDNGVLDLSAYFSMLMENIKSAKEEAMGLADMFGGPEAMIGMLTSNPAGLLMKGATSTLIPRTMKKSMEEFNKTLEGFFAGAMDKLENKSFKGPFGDIFDLIKGSLFPKSGFKDTVDTSNYNKDRAVWMGTSQKALEEVIPTYLSEIASALTGGPRTRYNYTTGKFETLSGIKNVQDQRLNRAAQSAGGEFRDDVLSVADLLDLSDKEKKEMKQHIEDYFLNAFKTGRAKATDVNSDNFDYQSFGLDKQSWDVIRKVLNSYEKDKTGGSVRKALQFASDVRIGRDSYGDQIRYLEQEANNPLLALFNNSSIIAEGDKTNPIRNGGLLGLDQYNHDIFYYLQGIYQYTGHVSDNLGLLATGTGKARKRGKVGKGGISPVRDIDISPTPQDTQDASSGNTSSQRPRDGLYKDLEDAIKAMNARNTGSTNGYKRKISDKEKAEINELEDQLASGTIGQDTYEKKKKEIEDRYKTPLDKQMERLQNNSDEDSGHIKTYRKILDRVQSIFNKPAEVVSEILTAGNISMYHLVYGKNDDSEKGLFGYFYSKMDNLFDKFDKFLQDKWDFSLKEWAKNLFRKAKDSDVGKSTGQELKNAAKWMGKDITRMLGFGGGDDGTGETEPIDNGNAAFGRKVTKTGIVAVSEGEMIIPSQYNPFYHGTNNKRTQLARENSAKRKFFGRFAEGGTVGEDDEARRADYQAFWENLVYRDDGTVNVGRSNRNNRIAGGVHNARDFVVTGWDQLVNGVQDLFNRLVPNDIDKENNVISKALDSANAKVIGKEAQNNAGAMGAGAIIGAGASILSGALVGPIAGAAIGAGAGLVIRSEKVQKLLFGEEITDEDGNVVGREGGVLSKKMSDFITQKVPTIAKMSGLGMVGGLFMGSPVLGAMLGGAVGFAMKSEAVHAKLFGKQNEDGSWDEGLIKKDLQDKIKKSAPNIGAGMLAGAIAGPFGIVGNLMVGGALGYVSTTDKFQDIVFGKADSNGNRTGGIVDQIKDNIFGKKGSDGKREGGMLGDLRTYFFGKKNAEIGEDRGLVGAVLGIVDKLGREMGIHTRNMFKDIGKHLRQLAAKGVKSTLGQTIANSKIVKAGKGLARGAFGLAKAPFKGVKSAARGMDNALTRRALRNGYNIRNADGSMMNAEQRQAARERLGLSPDAMNSYTNLDRFLANGETSDEDIMQLQTVLQRMEDPTKAFDQDEIKYKNQFASELDKYGVDPKVAKKLEKMLTKKTGSQDLTNAITGLNLNDEQTQALLKIQSNVADVHDNRNKAKADKNAYRRELLQKEGIFGKVKGIDIKSDSDIRNYLDLISADLKSRESQADQKKQEEAENRKEEAETATITIRDTVQRIYDHLMGNDDNNRPTHTEEPAPETDTTGSAAEQTGSNRPRSHRDNSEDSSESDDSDGEGHNTSNGIINRVMTKIGGFIDKIKNRRGGSDTGLADERDDIVTQTNMFGDIVQYRRSEQGELVPDISDSETRNSMESTSKFKQAMMSIPGIGAAMAGFGGILGSIKDKLFGRKDEKEGIFSKLFNGLFGEDGFISGIFHTITDSPIGRKVKDVLGDKHLLGGIFSNVIAPALLIGGFSGAFDGIASKLTNGAYGQGSVADEKTATVTTSNGEQVKVHQDENGNWVDDTGKVYDQSQINDINVRKTSPDSFSDRLKYNTARGILTNTKSVASTVLGRTSIGKGVTGVMSNIVKSFDADDAVAAAARTNLADTVLNACIKFTGMLRKIPALANIADKLDDMGLELAEKISTKLASESAKKVAEFAKNAVIWAKVAFIVIDFTTGYEDARTTLGITAEPTVGQRIISGLLRAIKNFIPIIGSLIPDSLVIDVFCKYIAPVFGIDASELMAQREEALEDVANYNAATGSNIQSVGEFNKDVLKDYTWTERIGNSAKSTLEDMKLGASNMVNGIKEKGIGGYISDSVKDMGSTFINSYKENGGGIAGIFSGMGDTFQKLLPGIFGDIAKANSDIRSYAARGELGNLWKVTLPDFSGGGEAIEGTDLTTAVPGIFSKIIGQVPLIVTKITSTPFALISGLFGKIKDFFNSDTFGDFAKGTDNILGVSEITEKAKQGDLGAVWSYSPAGEDDNGFMKVVKTIPSTVTKIGMTVPTLFFALGNKIKGFIDGVVAKVKNTGANIKAVQDETKAIIEGDGSLSDDMKSFFDFSKYSDEDGNPLGGISKAVMFATRISTVGNLIFARIGRSIKNFVGGVIDKVKLNVGAVAKDYMSLKDTADSGDVSGLWNQEALEVEGSPINGFTKAAHVASKISMTPSAIFHLVGNKVKEFLGKITNGIKSNVNAVATDYIALKTTAESGNVSGLWNQETTSSEDSPINGFTKAAHVASKISLTPNAIFHLVGNKVKEFIDNIVNKVKTNVGAVSDNYTNIKNLADKGDVSGLWGYDNSGDESAPTNGFVKAALFATKVSSTPSAIFHFVGGKISDFISKKVEAAKTDYNSLSKTTDTMKEIAGEGDVGGIWKQEVPKFSEDNVLAPIYKAIFNIQKVFYTVNAVMHKVFGFVGDAIDGVKEKFGTIVDGAKDFVDGVKDTVSDTLEDVGKAANGAWEKFKGWITGGNSGLPRVRRRRYVGAGSNKNEMFVSQVSDSYSSIPFGNSTIGDIGCAPAAATMLANFNKPGSINMNQAIREASKYDQGTGTSADYFEAVFKKRGISSNYIDAASKKGKEDLIADLSNGRPAILLGEDTGNDSKANSPFGPNSHYVMAKGFDKFGNIIINDPESDRPDIAYNPSILDKVNMGITTDQVGDEDTDAMMAYNKKFGNAVGAGGVPDNEISKNIWGFFTKNGFSPAATAGIMGNIYAESGVNPSIIQGHGKGPAAGLFQWENYNTKSSRWLAMNNYAASKGKNWTDLNSQLEYALSEINSNDINNRLSRNHTVTDTDGKTYNIAGIGGTNAFKKGTDPVAAMEQFEAAFERAGKPNFAKRRAAATEYYNLYSGSQYTGNYDSSVGNATGGTSYGDSSSGTSYGSASSETSSSGGIGDILGTITSAFTTGFGKIFGGNDNASTSSGSYGGSYGSSGSSDSSASYGAQSGDVAAANTPEGKGTAQSFIDIAKSQLGVVEKYDNITPYGKFTGTDGQAWCAAFVSWCMDQAFNHDKNRRNKALRGNISASVSGLWDNFKRAGAMTNTPQPGDIVIYKNGSSHTGLVETVNGDNITTIEGNTSGGNGFERNGGMVARKSFNIKQHNKLTGFGRPDWDGAASMGKTGAGSGLLGVKRISTPKPVHMGGLRNSRYIGGASDISPAQNMPVNVVSDSTIVTLLKTLVKLVENISTNTDNIGSIGTTLTNYCEGRLQTDLSSAKTQATSSDENSNKVDPENDPALQDLMATLGAIAQG